MSLTAKRTVIPEWARMKVNRFSCIAWRNRHTHSRPKNLLELPLAKVIGSTNLFHLHRLEAPMKPPETLGKASEPTETPLNTYESPLKHPRRSPESLWISLKTIWSLRKGLWNLFWTASSSSESLSLPKIPYSLCLLANLLNRPETPWLLWNASANPLKPPVKLT